jgi:hypothetical protein
VARREVPSLLGGYVLSVTKAVPPLLTYSTGTVAGGLLMGQFTGFFGKKIINELSIGGEILANAQFAVGSLASDSVSIDREFAFRIPAPVVQVSDLLNQFLPVTLGKLTAFVVPFWIASYLAGEKISRSLIVRRDNRIEAHVGALWHNADASERRVQPVKALERLQFVCAKGEILGALGMLGLSFGKLMGAEGISEFGSHQDYPFSESITTTLPTGDILAASVNGVAKLSQLGTRVSLKDGDSENSLNSWLLAFIAIGVACWFLNAFLDVGIRKRQMWNDRARL